MSISKIDMNNGKEIPLDNRRVFRAEFAFPIKFNIYSRNSSSSAFSGFIRNMSVGGACIQFDDKYGRVDIDGLGNKRVRFAVNVPDGEQVFFNSTLIWGRKESPKNGISLLIGVEFAEMTDWQVETLEKFIALRNKDHKMIWNLMDTYME